MTGTETDNHCMSGMPTTTPSSYAITFHVVGCGYDGGGQIDDTIAVRTSSGPQISSREYVCVDATSGLLAYSLSQTQRCIPTNPTPDTIVVEGTLQR